MSTGQDFSSEFNIMYRLYSSMHSLSIVTHCLLRLDYIFKHCLHFLHSVRSTLNLQLLNHLLFSIVVRSSLVQKSESKQKRIESHEFISSKQAAEKSDNRIKLFVNFFLLECLETLFKLVISIKSNDFWGFFAFIHEVLEGLVSCLLELHVIFERIFNCIIHFLFEIE